MYTKSLTGLYAFGLFLASSLASPVGVLQARESCHPDNVLRALERFSASASPFCSAYISIAPTSTVYVTTPIATPTITINPTALPSYVSQYEPSRVSSACSCLSIPPATITLPAIPDSTCDNEGLAYAVQSHDFYNNPPEYASVVVDYFKTAAPIQSGFTRAIGFVSGSEIYPFSIYGSPPVSISYKAINHRGYFVPPVTGEYTISAANTDDLILVWLGPNAFDGAYTRDNTVLEQRFNSSPETNKLLLNAGQYYPLRVLLINGQGPASFGLQISGPEGQVVVSPTSTEPTPWFVQFSCDDKSPAFKPFGSEL